VDRLIYRKNNSEEEIFEDFYAGRFFFVGDFLVHFLFPHSARTTVDVRLKQLFIGRFEQEILNSGSEVIMQSSLNIGSSYFVSLKKFS